MEYVAESMIDCSACLGGSWDVFLGAFEAILGIISGGFFQGFFGGNFTL